MNHAARTPFLPSVRLLPVRDSDTRLVIPDKFHLPEPPQDSMLCLLESNPLAINPSEPIDPPVIDEYKTTTPERRYNVELS